MQLKNKQLLAAAWVITLATLPLAHAQEADATPQTEPPVENLTEESATTPFAGETSAESTETEATTTEAITDEPAPESATAPAESSPMVFATEPVPLPAAEGMAEATPSEAAPAVETIAVQELRPEPQPAAPEPEGDVQALESIEVTATYRKENIQDVTGSAQAFSGRALDKAGVVGMEDYLRQVPSVSLQKSGNGKANIAMRGISNVNANDTGYAAGSPTVGVYMNDVGIQGSGVFPDLNIFDLQRIEVLKGPQGTLYGEGSMGGSIKMVTNAPDTREWEARGELMFSKITDGDTSRDLRAAINIPLIEDKLGARVVGNTRVTGGFVDYTTLGREDANSLDANSLRAILSYRPWESLELEYMFLSDNEYRDQFPVVDEGQQEELTNVREEEQYAITEFTIHALTARWALPFANLTSVSALYSTYRDSARRTPVLQNVLQTQVRQTGETAPDIFSNAPFFVQTDLESFSQEFRLVSFGGDAVDWLGGVFYRDRSQRYVQEKRENTVPDDPTGLLTGILGGFNPVQGRQEKGFGDETYEQMAAYGEVIWNAIPSKLEFTGGLRFFQEELYFFIDTKFYGIEAYLLGSDPRNIDPATREVGLFFEQAIKTSGVLPKLSAAWHFNEDHMIYATIARGFRSGTPNIYAGLQSGPPVVEPDYVWNKEIGTKSTWLDGRLITNLAVYHIDWQDLQGTVIGTARLGIVPTDFAHLDNAGDAVIIGAEGSVMWTPADGLLLLLSAGYNDGRITKPNPSNGIPQDALVPNSPRLTWSSTVNYSRQIGMGVIADFSVNYTFVDKQLTIYEVEDGNNNLDGFPIDSYDLIKASVGLKRNRFRVQLFGENLADKRSIIGISQPIPQYTVITPRNVGIRLGYEF